MKAWRQLGLDTDAALRERAMAGLAAWKRDTRWFRDGAWRLEFIPLPASWIRGRRWEDESIARPAAAASTAPAAWQPAGEPPWWEQAGFECRDHAANFRCHAGNFREFRNGERIPEGTPS